MDTSDFGKLRQADSRAVQALLLADQHGWSAWVRIGLEMADDNLFGGRLPARLEEQLQKLFLEFVLGDYPQHTAEFLRSVFVEGTAALRAVREQGGILRE